MLLYEAIKHIYPNIKDSEFSLRDDGFGPYIHSWSYGQQAPTQSEVDSALPVVTFQSLTKQFDSAVEAYLHAEAVSHGYTNIERACMYAPVPNPYEAESRSFVEWVGSVWAYCYQELQKVQAGTRPVPTVEQILSELPTRVIPS